MAEVGPPLGPGTAPGTVTVTDGKGDRSACATRAGLPPAGAGGRRADGTAARAELLFRTQRSSSASMWRTAGVRRRGLLRRGPCMGSVYLNLGHIHSLYERNRSLLSRRPTQRRWWALPRN